MPVRLCVCLRAYNSRKLWTVVYYFKYMYLKYVFKLKYYCNNIFCICIWVHSDCILYFKCYCQIQNTSYGAKTLMRLYNVEMRCIFPLPHSDSWCRPNCDTDQHSWLTIVFRWLTYTVTALITYYEHNEFQILIHVYCILNAKKYSSIFCTLYFNSFTNKVSCICI